MNKRLRVGIIGSGGIFNFGIGPIVEQLDFDLAAVADPYEEQARQRWRDRGVEIDVPFIADYRDMLSKENLDAVLIGLPSHLHHQVTLDALDAGLHVLCEKPPTENAREMIEIYRKVHGTNLQYQFVRQSRFGSMVQKLKSLVDSGGLGNIYYAKTEWIRDRWFSEKGWRHDAAKGGGVLLDLGIHAYDNVWYALGCPQPVEVMSAMNTTFTDYAPPDVEYTADDSTVAMIRFENGMMLCMEVAFSMNTAGRYDRKGNGSSERVEWQKIFVYGDKGSYEDGEYLKSEKDRVTVGSLTAPPDVVPHAAQVRNFFESIQGTVEPANTAGHAVQLMQVLDAAKKSSRDGKAVRIEKLI